MSQAKRSTVVNIVFIGNSFTQRNNLPSLMADLAAERGVIVNHKLISAGGASLRCPRRSWSTVLLVAVPCRGCVCRPNQTVLGCRDLPWFCSIDRGHF